MYSMPVEPFVF